MLWKVSSFFFVFCFFFADSVFQPTQKYLNDRWAIPSPRTEPKTSRRYYEFNATNYPKIRFSTVLIRDWELKHKPSYCLCNAGQFFFGRRIASTRGEHKVDGIKKPWQRPGEVRSLKRRQALLQGLFRATITIQYIFFYLIDMMDVECPVISSMYM